MTDPMMELSAKLTRAPVCKACGGQTHFEIPEVSASSYVGRVRVACECGHHGTWHEYDYYAVSFPAANAILRETAAAYAMGNLTKTGSEEL